jgi:hypothetical protein
MTLSAGKLMSMLNEGNADTAPSITAKAVEYGDASKGGFASGQAERRQLRVAISSISATRAKEPRSVTIASPSRTAATW